MAPGNSTDLNSGLLPEMASLPVPVRTSNEIKSRDGELKHSDEVNLDLAELAVHRSTNRFESALVNLANKVQENASQVQRTVEAVNEKRERLLRARDRVIETKDRVVSSVSAGLEPVRPYVQRAVRLSNEIAADTERNPAPYIFAAVSLILSGLLMGYVQSRRRERHWITEGEGSRQTTIYHPSAY